MTDLRIIPASQAQAEIRISNSTFIASAGPVFSVEEAKAFIDQIKARYADATHNVPVYIIGHPPSVIEHSNDDGEPAGTAGRPALSVLRGSGFGDIAIVITRYFGGTKLGTGGLVRAYSEAVRSVLEILPKAEKAATITTEFTVGYPLYEQTQQLVEAFDGNIENQNFEIDVRLRVKFREDAFEKFQQNLIQLTNGQVRASIAESQPDDIFPLSPG
jgi:uncharacterized YigZ family protein